MKWNNFKCTETTIFGSNSKNSVHNVAFFKIIFYLCPVVLRKER